MAASSINSPQRVAIPSQHRVNFGRGAFAVAIAIVALLGAAGRTRADAAAVQMLEESVDLDVVERAGEVHALVQAHWQQVEVPDAISLVLPSAGSVAYAASDARLWVSQDSGQSWTMRSLPRAGGQYFGNTVAVSASDPRLVLAVGTEGIYRSRDQAVTWQLTLPWSRSQCCAEPGAAYLTFGGAIDDSAYAGIAHEDTYALYRTTDQGETWELIQNWSQSACTPWVSLLQAHAVDPERVFQVTGCGQGFSIAAGHPLQQSTDGGFTWTFAFQQPSILVNRLVGGSAARPERWYLAGFVPALGFDGSVLERSDDDGQSWQEIGTGLWDVGGDLATRPHVGGLTFDPERPDLLWVGLSHNGDGVWSSTSAGASWHDLGLESLGGIDSLALTSDRRVLLAATAQGLWRLELAPDSEPVD